MILRSLLYLLAFILLYGCQDKQPVKEERVSPQEVVSGVVQISDAKNEQGSGTSSGPELLQYANYPAAEIFDRLSSLPVEYNGPQPGVVNLRYHFPKVPLEVARSKAIEALADFLDVSLDTVIKQRNFLVLYPEGEPDTLIQRVAEPSGTKMKLENGTLSMFGQPVSEIIAALNEHRSELFLTDAAEGCCYSFIIPINSPVTEMQQAFIDCCGIRLEKERRKVEVLLVK